MTIDRIAHGYFFAKQYIINKGFSSEIDWQDSLDYDLVTEQKFLEQVSWVILSSGMNERVIRKIFPSFKSAMFNFESAELISENRKTCLRKSLRIFNHLQKINAILFVADYLSRHSFISVKEQIKKEGPSFLQLFPYLGKATSFHLAKNLGLQVSKPDRHLNRISNALGFRNSFDLCRELSNRTDEKIPLIDLVLWRYATLDKNYSNTIKWFVKRYTD